MNAVAQKIIPSILLDFASNLKKRTQWTGDYSSWEKALQSSGGYNNQEIANKVFHATCEVIKGNAAFERDSMLFYHPEYNWQLLSSLFYIHNIHKKLHLLDFGGALGSTYFQHKRLIENLENISWNIIEQKTFLDVAQNLPEINGLLFFENCDEYFKNNKADVVLLSSVLQYIEKPYELIQYFGKINIPFLIIDLTGIHNEDHDRICVQHVNPSIYQASYPCRIFSEHHLLKAFSEYFDVICDFNSYIGQNLKTGINKTMNYKGYLLKHK